MQGQDSTKADNARRTPAWLLTAARELMYGIDLDPASDAEAQREVKARQWLGPGKDRGPGAACVSPHIGQNGLASTWFGRVWLNPPGGKYDAQTLLPKAHGLGLSSAAVWWHKLTVEYLQGNVDQALFLCFSLNVFRTGQWPQTPAPYEFPFLVFKDRIRFPGSDGSRGESPNVDSALVYLPPRVGTDTALAKFSLIFGQYGKVRI